MESTEQDIEKNDGLQNIFTGRGIPGRDNKRANGFTSRSTMPEAIADDIFGSEGIGRKVVTLPVYEMLRAGFEMESEELEARFRKLKFVKTAYELLTWDRLYGGAVLVAGVSDGGTLDSTLKGGGSPNDLKFLRAFSKHRVVMNSTRSMDVNDEYFDEPEWLEVYPRHGNMFRVHRSRCYILKGALSTDSMKQQSYGYWGDSILTPLIDYVERYIHSLDSSDDILEDFIQTILQIDNLQALVVNGQDKIIKKRLELLDMGRTTKKMILLDSKEKYEKSASTVTGIEKIIEKFEAGLCAVADIPATRLFGKSPDGMNSTGESDLRNWYDRVAFEQQNDLVPLIEWLQEITGSPIGVTMSSLREENPTEMTANRERQSKVDQLYYDMGVLTAQEIRDSRFCDDGGFSYSTKINDDLSVDLPEPTEEPEPMGSELE